MDRREIEGALEELGSELETLGIAARLFVVGGAVMVLDFGIREMTDDIDAGVYPSEKVLEIAARIGQRRGVNPQWLNDATKISVPVFKQPDWRPVMRLGTLEVFAADARSMLAMKMRASRGRRDEADLVFLLDECGIRTEEEAVSLYDEYFPEDPMPDRALSDDSVRLGCPAPLIRRHRRSSRSSRRRLRGRRSRPGSPPSSRRHRGWP